jgi:hypothetical protein
MDSISREKLIEEMREYSQTLASDIGLSMKLQYAASVAHFRSELESVTAFLAHLEATAKAAPAKKVSSKPRCLHYASIRRFYAIARDAHLSVKDDDAIRASLSRFLGRSIESRESLSGSEWESAATAVKCGELTW